MNAIGRRAFLEANAAALAASVWPRRSGFLSQASDRVIYHLRYDADAPGRLVVTITPQRAPGPIELVTPRAIPMGYGFVNYDEFVEGVRAWSPTGELLPVRRADGPRWRVGRAGAPVERVRYAVDVTRLEEDVLAASDASKSRDGYLGLLGYSVLSYIDGQETLPVRIDLRGPVGWPAFCTLDPKAEPWPGVQSVNAPDFYAAADAQILMGPAIQVRQLAGTRPLFLVGYAEGPADLKADGALIEEAFRSVVDWFGGAPFPHYSAVVEYLRPITERHQYNFSMEHLESSTYFMDRRRALNPKSSAEDKERNRFNYAHHIVHSWLPKRLYGEGYYPFRWELPPIIDTIWFSEGFARWIAIDALATAATPEERGTYHAQQLGRLEQMLSDLPALFRTTSLVSLSRIGSTQYSNDFRTGVALFTRGAMLADEVDGRIREGSRGAKSLRDSIRAMLVWAARERRGFTLGELPQLIGQPVGVDVGSVFQKWLA
jgi:predicted metalloprotease with PDZ domain